MPPRAISMNEESISRLVLRKTAATVCGSRLCRNVFRPFPAAADILDTIFIIFRVHEAHGRRVRARAISRRGKNMAHARCLRPVHGYFHGKYAFTSPFTSPRAQTDAARWLSEDATSPS